MAGGALFCQGEHGLGSWDIVRPVPGADQGPSGAPKPWPAGVVGRAASLAAWIAACDLGLKVMARAGGCADAPGLGTVVSQPWSAPSAECAGAPLWGGVLLRPAVRDGAMFGVAGGSVTGVTGQLWASRSRPS